MFSLNEAAQNMEYSATKVPKREKRIIMANTTTQHKGNGYGAKLARFLRLHLGQIPYIFLYPISAVIQFLYSCVFRLYNAVKDYYQELTLTQKRLTRLTRKAVRAVLNNRSDLMSAAWMRQMCRIFTGLLQIVSLVTTYAGLNFFLGSVSPFAAIALAAVIQGTAWSLLNFRGGRKRTGNGIRTLLLVIALCLSTLTSFIGISNVVHSPIQDMKQSYTAYYTAHQEYLADMVTKTDMFTLNDVQAALDQCEAIAQRADQVLDKLDNQRPDQKSLRVEYRESKILGYDPQTNTPIIGTSTTTGLQSNMNQLDKTLQALHTELKNSIAALSYRNLSQLPKAEDILSDAIQTENPAQANGAYATFFQCLQEYATLEKEINDIETQGNQANVLAAGGKITDVPTIDQITLNLEKFGAGLIDNYKEKDTQKQELQMKSYEEIVKGVEGDLASIGQSISWLPQPLQEPLRILFPNELQYAERIRTALNEEMDNAFVRLPGEVQNNSNHKVSQTYHVNHLPSSQLYPFKYLRSIKDPNWGISLFALGLAAVIDLFSLFLSLSLIKRRDSVLYANHHKENIKNREELLEDCYTYICVQQIFAQQGQNQKTVCKTADIYPYVAETIEKTMRDFLGKFNFAYLPRELDSFGYLGGEEVKELDFAQKNLFQTLRLIQLIHSVTPNELTSLLESDFYNLLSSGDGGDTAENGSEPQNTLPKDYLTQFPEKDIIFLADNRLLMWFNENFSSLLQTAIPNIVSPENEGGLTGEGNNPGSQEGNSEVEKEAEAVGAPT